MSRSDALTVSVIVVSYNTCDMTLACLDSLFEQTVETDIEVIVVDNASSDGSYERIEDRFGTKAQVIQSETNLGFAAGTNLGATLATGEYVLLLNPDTIVLSRAIDELVRFAVTFPHAGIWGGRTEFSDGSLNTGYCWAPPSIWSLTSQALGLTTLFPRSRLFNPEAVGVWITSPVTEVPVVSGCFLLTKRVSWERLGGFDPDFFMYGEEVDLCIRAEQRLGFRPMVTSRSSIVHHGGASEAVRSDMIVKLLSAKALLVKKHLPHAAQPLALVLLRCWPLTRLVAHSLLSILGRDASKAAAQEWSEVHRQRDIWH